MSIDENLADYFKPEERKRGGDLAGKDLVVISSASDTDVRAFVKASTACKVSLAAENVSAPVFTADCTCPASRKGILCKHIWAVLMKLEEKGLDFLEGKREVEKLSAAPRESETRQNEYQKQQYTRQKERAKEMRRDKRKAGKEPAFSYPPDVEAARGYFSQNGFPLEHPLDMEALANARRILSRVFHPDKGGTHQETITLNQNFEVIRDYLNS